MDKEKVSVDGDGRRFVEKPLKSAIPFWGCAAVWIIAAAFFPMYSIWTILLAALASVVVFVILKLVIPKEKIRVEVPFASGNVELDEAVNEIGRNHDILAALAGEIGITKKDAKASLESICATLVKIRDDLVKNPDDLKRCRRLLNYYLPTTVSLAKRYNELLMQSDLTSDIGKTMSDIERALKQIDTGLKSQLEALYEDDVVDISADIKVLDAMLEKDNLK